MQTKCGKVICLQLSNHIKNADAYRNNNEKNWEIFSRVQQICEIFRHLNKNENCFDFMETNCTCFKLTFLFIFFQ